MAFGLSEGEFMLLDGNGWLSVLLCVMEVVVYMSRVVGFGCD
jgi:hypothetical protein